MLNLPRLRVCATWLPIGLALAGSAVADVAKARANPSSSIAAPRARVLKHSRHTCDGEGSRRGDGNRRPPSNGANPPPASAPSPSHAAAAPIASTTINSFKASPGVVKRGQSTKLEWSTTNADTIALVPAISGTWLGDSLTIQPKETTTFALNVAGPGGAALQFITVRVDGPEPAKNPAVVVGGQEPPAASPSPAAVSGDDKHPGDYTLVFNDEFNGGALDRNLWCTRYSWGGGLALQVPDPGCTGPGGRGGTLDFLNAEQQRYKDTNAHGETMHVVRNGILSLRATKTGYDSYAAYEAALIRSKFEFKPTGATRYYVAARVRMPNVRGTWPALWLAPGFGSNGQLPWPPEIDIFEGTLNGRDVKHNMIRMGSQIRGAQTSSGDQEVSYHDADFDVARGNYAPARSLRDVWLVIGADWARDGICYFVDGVKTMCESYRWLTNEGSDVNGAQLLLNLAIGGEWAGSGGIEDSYFPTSFDLDYVRVYRN